MIKLDLNSDRGIPISLLATAGHLSRAKRINADEVELDMRGGDYEHLVRVFEKYFGGLVDISNRAQGIARYSHHYQENY